MKLARISSPPVAGDLVNFAGLRAVVVDTAWGGDPARTRVRFDKDDTVMDVMTADLRHLVVDSTEDVGKSARLLPRHKSYAGAIRRPGDFGSDLSRAVGTVIVNPDPHGHAYVPAHLRALSGLDYIVTGTDHGDTAVLVAAAPQPAGVAELDAGARGFGLDLPAADLELVRETIHARGPRDDEHIDAIAHVVRAFAAGKRTSADADDMRAVHARIVSLTVPSRPATDAVKRVADRFAALPVDTTDERARTLFETWAEAVNAGLTWDGQSASAQHGWRTLAAHLEQQP